jgi:hypothetical protein
MYVAPTYSSQYFKDKEEEFMVNFTHNPEYLEEDEEWTKCVAENPRMCKFIEDNSILMDKLDDEPVSKDTKALQGVHKVSTHVIPTQVILELGLALTEGSLKYGGDCNWRANKVLASVYYDAFNRHMLRWFNGEAVDKDSGVSHLVKAMANLTILRDAELTGSLIDDRDKNPVDFDAIDAKAAALYEKYKAK